MKAAKKAIKHFKDDMRYYAKESKEDKDNIKAIKKSKSLPKKRLTKHLKGDVKGFKEEIQEDKELIRTLRGVKNHERKKKACCKGCEEGHDCKGKKRSPRKRVKDEKKSRRLKRRKVQKSRKR